MAHKEQQPIPKPTLTELIGQMESVAETATQVDIQPLIKAFKLYEQYPNLAVPIIVSGMGLHEKEGKLSLELRPRDIIDIIAATKPMSPELKTATTDFVAECAQDVITNVKAGKQHPVNKNHGIIDFQSTFVRLWDREQRDARRVAAGWAVRLIGERSQPVARIASSGVLYPVMYGQDLEMDFSMVNEFLEKSLSQSPPPDSSQSS